MSCIEGVTVLLYVVPRLSLRKACNVEAVCIGALSSSAQEVQNSTTLADEAHSSD